MVNHLVSSCRCRWPNVPKSSTNASSLRFALSVVWL